MIDKQQPDGPGAGSELAGDFPVDAAWRRIARRMVVDDQEFMGVELQGALQDGAYRKAGLIRGSPGNQVVAEQLMPAVQIEHAHALDPAMRRHEVEIVVQLIAIGEEWPTPDPLLQDEPQGRADRNQMPCAGVRTGMGKERVGLGGEDRVQSGEAVEQPVGDLDGLSRRDRPKQGDQLRAVLRVRAWASVPPIRISTWSIGQTIVMRS